MSRQHSSIFTETAFDPIECEHLINAIANGKAVLFLGAGVSVGAKLPTWRTFMEELLKKYDSLRNAKPKKMQKEVDREKAEIRQCIEKEDYPRAFELFGLRTAHHPEFLNSIRAQLKGKWNEVHAILTTIPFQLVLTTNLDTLLEDTKSDRYEAILYDNEGAFYTAVRASSLATVNTRKNTPLVYIRGHVKNLSDKQSEIFGEAAFRSLSRNAFYNTCMSTIFATRTVLFVGCSLKDPDILRLLEQNKKAFTPDAAREEGRHFAILPDFEAGELTKELLEKHYGVKTISYSIPNGDTGSGQRNSAVQYGSKGDVRSASEKIGLDAFSKCVLEILKRIAGAAAKRISEERSLLFFGQSDFSQKKACKQLIRDICVLTGSDRGDIFFIEQPNSRKLRRFAEHLPPVKADDDKEQSKSARKAAKNTAEPFTDSICSTLLLQRKIEGDFVYLKNTVDRKSRERDLKSQNYSNPGKGNLGFAAKYQELDSRVQSELACPILADGECVGVLNLESFTLDAYTADHLEAAKVAANEAGAAYVAAIRRSLASRGIGVCTRMEQGTECATLANIFAADPLQKDTPLKFILWRRDFIDGKLHEYSPFKGEKLAGAPLLDYFLDTTEPIQSLAEICCIERRRIVVADSESELKKMPHLIRLNEKGVRAYRIKGPVIGIPIRSMGHLAGVLVAWRKHWDVGNRHSEARFLVAAERMHRIADVLANLLDESHLEQATDLLCKLLRASSDGGGYNAVTSILSVIEQFHENSQESFLPFPRIRLFVGPPENRKAEPFMCVWHSNHPEFDCAYDKQKFETVESGEHDEYFKYTLRRSKTDPYARVQDVIVNRYGKACPDSNRESFVKAAAGCWIVAPIAKAAYAPTEVSAVTRNKSDFVESYSLLGFVSIDSHKPADPSSAERPEPEDVVGILPPDERDRRLRFQRRFADVLTHILASHLVDDDTRAKIRAGAGKRIG